MGIPAARKMDVFGRQPCETHQASLASIRRLAPELPQT
jgi:hypothetical protein